MSVAHEASHAGLTPAVSATVERLFREHSGWIYGYCLRLLRSPEEAEDALQTTYLNACRSLSQGVQPRADSAWLLRITQNTCLTRLRWSGRRAGAEYTDGSAEVAEMLAAPDRPAEDLIGLTEALASLPERQRRAILLREWQGLSYREVAHRLGLTQGAVETLIFRARRGLAAALEDPARRVRSRSVLTLDLGGLLTALKGIFSGAAAVQAVAAVVVAATVTAAATDPAHLGSDRSDRPGPAAVVGPPAPPSAVPRTGDVSGPDSAALQQSRSPRPAVPEGRPDRAVDRTPRSEATPEPTSEPTPSASESPETAPGDAIADPRKARPEGNRRGDEAVGHARRPDDPPRRSARSGAATRRPESVGRDGEPPQPQPPRQADGTPPTGKPQTPGKRA